jgi:hypothetical protein
MSEKKMNSFRLDLTKIILLIGLLLLLLFQLIGCSYQEMNLYNLDRNVPESLIRNNNYFKITCSF